jgi:hypothetical protein
VTPFMIAVSDVLDGRLATPEPAVAPSVPGPVQVAVGIQAAMRARAGQLASEANSVLQRAGTGTGEIGIAVITLADERGPGALAFTLGYRDRSAQVRTDIASGRAQASVIIPGRLPVGIRQLASEAEVHALVLSLIGG